MTRDNRQYFDKDWLTKIPFSFRLYFFIGRTGSLRHRRQQEDNMAVLYTIGLLTSEAFCR